MDGKGPDPKVVASNVYNAVLENDRVRVFDVRFKPGAKAEMHWHPDHVAYVVSGGKLKVTETNGKVTDMDLMPGQAVFLEAQSHEAVNTGSTEVHVVVVELMK